MVAVWTSNGKVAEGKGVHSFGGRHLPVSGYTRAIFLPGMGLQLESFSVRKHHAGVGQHCGAGELLLPHRKVGDAVPSMLGVCDGGR